MLFNLKNSPYRYVDFDLHQGRRLRPSTGTLAKRAAHEFAKHREVELWRQEKLGERPRVTWNHAVIERLQAHEHKRSIEDDRTRRRKAVESLPGIDLGL